MLLVCQQSTFPEATCGKKVLMWQFNRLFNDFLSCALLVQDKMIFCIDWSLG